MDRNARKLGRFYTPAHVAAQLVSMLEVSPSSIVDLGCGAGALSHAAVARWGARVSLTTVDVDPEAGPRDVKWSRRHRHVTADLLFSDPFESILEPAKFDLALLNPPYGREREVARALAHIAPHYANAKGAANRCCATAFMLHALNATKSGGVVAAILPQSLATSSTFAPNRAAMSRLASIERIALLPARTFAATEARTVMVILRKIPGKPMNSAPWLPIERMKYPARRALRTLENLGVEIVRGQLNTVEARKVGAFHLDGFRSATDGFVRFDAKPQQCLDERCARAGDILVARIGRGIAHRIARVASGANAISDCVFRLRCPPEIAPRVWAGLHSEAGRNQLERAQAGLTARFLPMGSLRSIEV